MWKQLSKEDKQVLTTIEARRIFLVDLGHKLVKKNYIREKMIFFYLIYTFFRPIRVPNQPKNVPGPYALCSKNMIIGISII